ncbi:MAG: tetratricopeptide repeat protein [Proteobacteria bacterium]|nr:tetratricopeptide repeat protein [Pseudomonadota bacterium]
MVRSTIAFFAFSLLSVTALTQGVPANSEMTGPQVVNTPLSFSDKVARGHGMYANGDYAGALGIYEKAKEMDPGNAVVYYFIACSQAKLSRYDDARVTLKTASTLAGDKDQSLYAKAMFQIAVLEENRGRLDTAKEDWAAYKGYAQTHTAAVTFVSTADARLAAFEKKQKLDEEYKAVRERIASSQ